MYKLFCSIITRLNSSKYLRVFLTFLLTAMLTGTTQSKSHAVRYPDGKLAFESAILLTNTSATFNGIRARLAKYYFDLELPHDVGEPLGKVVVKQRTGGDEVKFKPDKTKVYLGTHNDKQEEISSTTLYNEETGEITVEFDRPVPPGSILTIGLRPKRNPDLAGVYLFGVTAFPPGEKSLGLYLGAGRLHFYQNDYSHF